MPQLSTLFIFTVYFWTWLILCLISQKIKTTLINKMPTNVSFRTPKKPTLTLPWT